jgi:hypothetical protein
MYRQKVLTSGFPDDAMNETTTLDGHGVVPARLGLKAPALARPGVALAFSNPRPGQSCYSRVFTAWPWLGLA